MLPEEYIRYLQVIKECMDYYRYYAEDSYNEPYIGKACNMSKHEFMVKFKDIDVLLSYILKK